MALQFLSATDLDTYLDEIQTNYGEDDFVLQIRNNHSPIGAYLHSFDLIAHGDFSFDNDVLGNSQGRIAFDPLLVDASTAGTFLNNPGPNIFTLEFPLWPGDPFNTDPAGQKLYASENSTVGTSDIEEVELPAFINTGAPAFPTVIPGNGPIAINRGRGAFFTTANDGGWLVGPTTPGVGGGLWWLMFEGLTDGIAGETVLTGANVYPKGLALVKLDEGTVPAPIGSGSNTANNALGWIDLDTGGLVGQIFATAGAASSGAEVNTEAPFLGNSFNWFPSQYIPDTDATFAIPKGRLLLHSNHETIQTNLALSNSIMVKVIEFNPLGVAPVGNAPTRVQGRQLLKTAVEFEIAPMFGVGGAQTGNETECFKLHFHPPTQRFFLIQAAQTPGFPRAPGKAFIGFWSQQVEATEVSKPVARDVPRTNDIVEYECVVRGSLGENVAGIDVDWSLVRNSTEGEILTGTFTPASTSTVANPPIDTDSSGAAILAVAADGVPLVLTTDYTVVASTGVITWVTDQSGAAVVTATYEHRTTDATPAHGTLLIASSQSGADGLAFTQVQYPDNDALVGTLDKLINTLA